MAEPMAKEAHHVRHAGFIMPRADFLDSAARLFAIASRCVARRGIRDIEWQAPATLLRTKLGPQISPITVRHHEIPRRMSSGSCS